MAVTGFLSSSQAEQQGAPWLGSSLGTGSPALYWCVQDKACSVSRGFSLPSFSWTPSEAGEGWWPRLWRLCPSLPAPHLMITWANPTCQLSPHVLHLPVPTASLPGGLFPAASPQPADHTQSPPTPTPRLHQAACFLRNLLRWDSHNIKQTT